MIVLWLATGVVLRGFGVGRETAYLAWYYAAVLAVCNVPRCFASAFSSFLRAQRINKPEVYITILGVVLNLVLGLQFVLGISVFDIFGYFFPSGPSVEYTVHGDSIHKSVIESDDTLLSKSHHAHKSSHMEERGGWGGFLAYYSWGFYACPIVTNVVEAVTLVCMWICIARFGFGRDCWPLSWRWESIFFTY